MQQNVIRHKMLVQQNMVQGIKYRKSALYLYVSFCMELPRKICEGYINSMEKCAECDNIRYEKCENKCRIFYEKC